MLLRLLAQMLMHKPLYIPEQCVQHRARVETCLCPAVVSAWHMHTQQRFNRLILPQKRCFLRTLLQCRDPPLGWQNQNSMSFHFEWWQELLQYSFSVYLHVFSVSLGVQLWSPDRGMQVEGGVDPFMCETMVAEPLSNVTCGQWQITFPHWDLIRN